MQTIKQILKTQHVRSDVRNVRLVNGEPESIVFDPLWRPIQTTNALDTFQLAYLGKTGQLTGITSNLGPQIQYTYAANIGDRRLLQIKNLTNSGNALSQFDYSYDAVGQISQLIASFDGGGNGGNGSGDGDGNGDDDCTCKKRGKRVGHKKGKGKGHTQHGKGHGYGHEADCKHKKNDNFKDWVKEILSEVWGWDLSDWDDCDDESDGGDDTGGGTGTTETWDFDYDNLSQLVGVDLNQTPYATYSFDSAGNLTGLTLDGVTTTFTYNALNQPNSPGSSAFDAKGQTTTDSEGRTFEWDEQGRVTAIVVGTQRSEFQYDGLSRRTVITEFDNGTLISQKLYWWLGGSIVTERDGLQTGFPITKRYFGQGLIDNGTKLFYTTDHLGSVRELLDDTGNIVAQYRYTIYGERTRTAGTIDSDFGYAGLFHHEPSGLDLATYRIYDAKQRRFISRDPLGEAVDYNLYRYGANNPVNYTDPEGLCPPLILGAPAAITTAEALSAVAIPVVAASTVATWNYIIENIPSVPAIDWSAPAGMGPGAFGDLKDMSIIRSKATGGTSKIPVGPYSPNEVSKRRSDTRRKWGADPDLDQDIPDQRLPGDKVQHPDHTAKPKTPHPEGQRNIGAESEHNRNPKGTGKRGGNIGH